MLGRLLALLTLPLVLAAPARAQDDADEAGKGDAWRSLRIPDGQGGTMDAATASQLAALGYVDGYVSAPSLVGVTRNDAALAFKGLNLVASGHGEEAVLMDMEGKVLHTWRYELKHWPPHPEVNSDWSRGHWRQVHLYDDGSILVLYSGQGLVKLTRDSELVWMQANMGHHMFEVQDDGGILLLTRHWEEHAQYASEPLLVDYVAVLDDKGQIQREINLMKALDKSEAYRNLWHDTGRYKKDIFHANSVARVGSALAGRLDGVDADDVLVSFRDLSTIAIVDLDTETVVWAAKGSFSKQHDADVTPDGQIMLFDNHHKWGAKASAIEVYDPATMKRTWGFSGTEAEPFWSQAAGVQQRLPNGNALICEAENGRAIEVTPDGKVVWEFYNPQRAGDNDELIAAIYEVNRYEEKAVSGWLKR